MAKFNTAAEARKVGAALFAAGKCTAWCEKPCFGKFGISVQIGGSWFNLRTKDVA
jgi:hypothetical protein